MQAANRSAVSRADLLRLLAVVAADQLTLGFLGDEELSFVRTGREDAQYGVVPQPARQIAQEGGNPEPSPPRRPLRMEYVHCIVEREVFSETDTTPPERPSAATLTTESNEERWSRSLPAYRPLVAYPRLLPHLRRALGATRQGGLDLVRLTDLMAGGVVSRQLPRHRLPRWHPQLSVVFDLSQRLTPYHVDMDDLRHRLFRACANAELATWRVHHNPLDGVDSWQVGRGVAANAGMSLARWRRPAISSLVLIVGDLGLLQGAQSAAAQAWLSFIRMLQEWQLRVVALVPLGAAQVDAMFTKLLPVLRWSPDAALVPTSGRVNSRHQPDGLVELLAMMACVRRVDPALLRAMRQLHPTASNDAGLEGAAWSHESVQAGMSASIRLGAVPFYLERLTKLERLHARLRELCRQHHAHLDAALECEEILLQHAHLGGTTADERERAREFLAGLSRFDARGAERTLDRQHVALGIVERADPVMRRKFHEDFARLGTALSRAVEPSTTVGRYYLVHDLESGGLLLQPTVPTAKQRSLGPPLPLGPGGAWVKVRSGDEESVRSLPADGEPALLARLDAPVTVEVIVDSETVTVGPVARPRGSTQWFCDGEGIQLRAMLCGREAKFTSHWPTRRVPQGLVADGGSSHLHAHRDWRPVQMEERDGKNRKWRLVSDRPHPLAPPQPSHPFFGFDEFGLYADLLIETHHSRATQRFRHIEPGTFLMGSPAEEPGRTEEEDPQHQVTLTRGFWLADTACTQALWTAVMGSNPSRDKGEELPVGGVSWDAAQVFLRELEKLLKDCRADLPTEAEWEYACRAGTTTPFSFGANITTDQVNYDGRQPYTGAARGEYRKTTLPVKSLPPNPWGLYEMHGNVWEWCADSGRVYTAQAVTDPFGALKGGSVTRAGRGGSWYYEARWARSACRFEPSPDSRHHWFGFRICLRSGSLAPGAALRHDR